MENFPNQFEDKDAIKAERLALALELSESMKTFSFPGIKEERYLGMKESEEEFPGYTTPIDELIARLESEGMKISLGKHPENGDVFALPAGSDDVLMDGILVSRLRSEGVEDGRLKRLIEV